MPSDRVAIVAAVATNGVIGRENGLPWRLPSDLAFFKRLTLGGTLVIGRRTHLSIGRTLPGRRTIVVTRTPLEGVETAPTLEDALAWADTATFLAGGSGIYAEGMAHAATLYLTRVAAAPAGDTLFPPIDPRFRLVRIEPGVRAPGDEHDFAHETWRRASVD